MVAGVIPKVGHCNECPIFNTGKGRCSASGAPVCDVYVLGGAPTRAMENYGFIGFGTESGMMYKSIMSTVKSGVIGANRLRIRYHHSAHCYDSNMNSDVIHYCSTLVQSDIHNANPKVILVLGAEAMRSLDIKGTVSEMRGQELTASIGNKDIPVVISFDAAALVRKEHAGKLPTVKKDIAMAYKVAINGVTKRKTIAEMTKDYLFCKTPQEFKDLVDKVLTYPADLPDGTKGPAEQNLLAIDTETAVEGNKYSAINTWVPGFKMIAISVSWAEGQSAGILLNHRANAYPYEDYKEGIARLCNSPNPKTFHNYKYDYKSLTCSQGFTINKVVFDSQMGEFLLDENKKGEYGLKKITKNRVPMFYGYEKMLHSPEDAAKKVIEDLKVEIANNTQLLKDMRADCKYYRSLIRDVNAELKIKPLPLDVATATPNTIRVWKEGNKATKDALLDKKEGHALTLKERKAELDSLVETNKAKKELLKQKKLEIANYKDMSFEDYDVDTMLLYAAIDTDISRIIAKQQIAEIKKDSVKLFNVLSTIMLPAARMFGDMEHTGVKVDLEYIEELKEHFDKVIIEAEHAVYEANGGRELNLNSANALVDMLTTNFGVKLVKKTKTGGWSTDSEVMEDLAVRYPIAGRIIAYKKAYKARWTFLEGILKGGKSPHDYGCSIDGRIHGNYNQTTAATGRLSSSQPNQQNIPLEILGKNIKKIFIPDSEEYYMVDLDYSAAEVRILTAYAPDKKLIQVLQDGLDTHSFVGASVFKKQGVWGTPGVTYDDLKNRKHLMKISPEEYHRLDTMRQIAKKVMFLTIYGGGAYTLRANLAKDGINMTEEECEGIIGSLLAEFPAIKEYMRVIKNTVNQKGEVETFIGRKRRFPVARFNFKLRKAAYREAINSPIQGTSSDVVIHQMIELRDKLESLGYKHPMRLTVHDSKVFQFPKKDIQKLLPILQEHCRDNVKKNFKWLPVDFEFDVDIGPSYGEAKNNLRDAVYDEHGMITHFEEKQD